MVNLRKNAIALLGVSFLVTLLFSASVGASSSTGHGLANCSETCSERVDASWQDEPSIYLQGGGGDVMMITIASDIALGTWTGSGGVSGTSAICVYHTGGSGYSITLTTSTANFRVVNGANYVTYTPSFSDSGVGGTYTALSYGVTQSFSGANTSSSSCSGSYNAALKIEVDEADLSSAQPGSYSATLTLVLTPS
jgi:hypothetical protein